MNRVCWYITTKNNVLKSIKRNSIYKQVYTYLMTFKINCKPIFEEFYTKIIQYPNKELNIWHNSGLNQ